MGEESQELMRAVPLAVLVRSSSGRRRAMETSFLWIATLCIDWYVWGGG